MSEVGRWYLLPLIPPVVWSALIVVEVARSPTPANLACLLMVLAGFVVVGAALREWGRGVEERARRVEELWGYAASFRAFAEAYLERLGLREGFRRRLSELEGEVRRR